MTFKIYHFYLKRLLEKGWLYIVIGLAIPLVFILASFLQNPSKPDFNGIFSVYPIILPLTGIWGMIPLVSFFASDRRTGFFEHLFATTDTKVKGVYYALFIDSILITVLILSIIIGVSLCISIVTAVPLPVNFVKTLIFYSIPVSIATPIITLLVAMTWSFTLRVIRGPLASNPAGIAPILGVALVEFPVFIEPRIGSFPIMYFLSLYSLSIIALLLSLAILALKLSKPERFLP